MKNLADYIQPAGCILTYSATTQEFDKPFAANAGTQRNPKTIRTLKCATCSMKPADG
jgi:hypothetical protein